MAPLILAGTVALLSVVLMTLAGAALARYGLEGLSSLATDPRFGQLFTILGPIGGFVTAWLTFELTERRRARMAQRAMRNGIVGELRHAELLLTNIILGCAFGPTGVGVEAAVKELRWLLAPERGRVEGVGFFEATGVEEAVVEKFRGISDPEIAALLKLFPSTAGRRPLEVHAPVIEAVLRTPQAGFTERQIHLLGSVRWQLQLLNDGAQWAHRFFEMTFTVADPTNHQIAVENYARCRDEHRRRAQFALDEIRNTIEVLARPRS